METYMSETLIKKEWAKVNRPTTKAQLNKAISEVKRLVAEIQVRKMKIAEIALSVCIEDGRGANRLIVKPKGLITIADFAKATGINKATLRDWIAAYLYGAKRLNPSNPSSVPYKDARRAAKVSRLNAKVGAGNTVQQKHKTTTTLKDIENYSTTYLTYTTKILSQLETQGHSRIPDGVKAELKIKLKQILKRLDK
jgi:phage antirepressor YoqD-like protein